MHAVAGRKSEERQCQNCWGLAKGCSPPPNPACPSWRNSTIYAAGWQSWRLQELLALLLKKFRGLQASSYAKFTLEDYEDYALWSTPCSLTAVTRNEDPTRQHHRKSSVIYRRGGSFWTYGLPLKSLRCPLPPPFPYPYT